MKELRIGIRSAPDLADHAFQDMVVLPGSFYIQTALSMECRVPSLVRNVIFQNPIILSAEATVINLQVRDQSDGRVWYAFYEAGSQQCAARLEIDRRPSTPSVAGGFSIEGFQAQSDAMIDSESFYRKLRENGNQYGPRFQRISAIWRAGDQCLGKVSAARELDPSLLDAMTQLLAPFIMDQAKTFILKSIAQIEIMSLDFPDTLWAHAAMRDRLVGDVRVFDQSGQPYLKLSGVTFSLLDRDEQPGANLVIAANFTAEPLEDSLNFWGDYFGVPIHTEFAPYNQVFQQLLDTASAFRKNTGGINVVLLALDEWTRQRPAGMHADKEKFANRPRYILPNGLEIVQLNQYETDYLYKEIFEEEAYLRHGLHLNDGDTVLDIGANIGLFSLFVMSRCKNPKIYAFEPAPLLYDLLKTNFDAYGADARAFHCGVSDQRKIAPFTFYEKSSVFSGFHSDENEDRAAIQTIVRNLLDDEADEYVDELTADRLRCTTHQCQLLSVSDIIRENQIQRINLLKIDAEKSELDILNGIDERDWPIIDQIVIEIHDRTGERVKRIKQLLKEKGFHCAIEEEKLLEHSGLFNLYASRDATRHDVRSDLTRNVQDFSTALRSFMDQSKVPLILCVTPSKAAVSDAEQTLLLEAGKIPNVHTISPAALLQRYPVKDYYDPHTHHAGHIPYTAEAYAAIGTTLLRAIFNLKSNPFKVIVLDCDNTLWKGVCGEDGAMGIEVPAPYRALQEFMIGQIKAGMLLCLCSKNNETDVLQVFDQRTDMLLQREHLVAWRLNWNRKSENIKSLAKELNLGLDSFIFIDDNPVDCADVKINCPEVLTLQLPGDPERFPSFLNHLWPFDRTGSTGEDQNRTRMYQENTERQKFRERTLSLKDFIQGLQLRIEIGEATQDQLARISQLTFRTNQFNFTTIRRSENELREFLNRQGAKCLAVRVADRFGDYGLVGVVLYENQADLCKVDTFLLSCRVLGRGVEHAVVSWLGRHAIEEGRKFVDLTYVPTQKNSPALEFIKSIGQSGASWTFPAERLASVEYDPDRSTPPVLQTSLPAAHWRAFGSADCSACLQRIGEQLCDMDRIAKAIEAHRLSKQAPPVADVKPGSTLEAALLNIWRKVLGRPRIGLDDNFFEAGGTSLRAVQVIAAIKKELKQTLSIVGLFECPTVSLLAAKLNGKSEEAQVETRTAGATARGQRRRYNLGGRPVLGSSIAD